MDATLALWSLWIAIVAGFAQLFSP